MIIPFYGDINQTSLEQNGGMYPLPLVAPLTGTGLLPIAGPPILSGQLTHPFITSDGQLLGGPFGRAHMDAVVPIPLMGMHPRLLISSSPVSNFTDLSDAKDTYKSLTEDLKKAGFNEKPTTKVNREGGYVEWKDGKFTFRLKDKKENYIQVTVKPSDYTTAKGKLATRTEGKNTFDDTNKTLTIALSNFTNLIDGLKAVLSAADNTKGKLEEKLA